MLCNKCGIELPDDATVCTQCGEVFEAAPAEETPAVEAPVVEETPASTPAAKAGIFEKIGAFVAKIPLLGKIKFLQTKTGILISAIAIFLVCAILFSTVAGILVYTSTPRAVAKRYAKVSMAGDRKTSMSLEAGKMKQYFQDRYEEDEDKARLFENMEEACEEAGVRANINTFGQYYRAYKKLNKAEMKEEFGAIYFVSIKVTDVEKMTDSQLENIRRTYSNERYAEYINPARIRNGKRVHITITIRGIEDTESIDTVISMVKYKGKWRVA